MLTDSIEVFGLKILFSAAAAAMTSQIFRSQKKMNIQLRNQGEKKDSV